MKTLLDNHLAPLTFSWGFLENSLDAVLAALTAWRKMQFSKVEVQPVSGSLPDTLRQLQPLLGPPTRELLLSTTSDWIAYFDNGASGGDPFPPISYLSERLGCRGVAVTCIPNSIDANDSGMFGAVLFELFSGTPTAFLNVTRSVGVTNDGGRWRFVSEGDVQPFERPEAYQATRVRDRFSPDLLEEYCNALGLEAFDAEFYGASGYIIAVEHTDRPAADKYFSLTEAQRRLGFL